jgi:molecular chaperone GrpE
VILAVGVDHKWTEGILERSMNDEKNFSADAGNVDDEIEIEFVDEEKDLTPVAQAPEPSEAAVTLGEDSARDEVDHLKTELDHVRDIYLRKLAEFDNFRKRVEREREVSRGAATEGLVKDLLPVLDNFERALQHADDDSGAFHEGVEMIAKQLWDVLERTGVAEVNPLGQPFDPELHEAVQRVEDSEQVPGTVALVMLKGFTLGDRLIRPAMVGVVVEPETGGDHNNGEGLS